MTKWQTPWEHGKFEGMNDYHAGKEYGAAIERWEDEAPELMAKPGYRREFSDGYEWGWELRKGKAEDVEEDDNDSYIMRRLH